MYSNPEWPSDDGSCASEISESSCLSRKSLFDSTRKLCAWTTQSHSVFTAVSNSHTAMNVANATTAIPTVTYSCVWIKPVFSVRVLIIVSLLVALLSGPLYMLSDKLVDVLLSPTQADIDAQHSKVAEQRNSAVVKIDMITDDSAVTAQKLKPRGQASMLHVTTELSTALAQKHDSAALLFDKLSHCSTVSSVASDRFDTLEQLRSAVLQYASCLPTVQEQKCFLSHWAVWVVRTDRHSDENDDHANVDSLIDSFKSVNLDSLASELDHAIAKADFYISKLTQDPPSHQGVELLQLFMDDLIGRDSRAAQVLHNHVQCFESQFVVTWGLKCLTVSVLIVLNMYAILLCLLYGRKQGHMWQRGWLYASIVNLLLDVCVKQVSDHRLIDV